MRFEPKSEDQIRKESAIEPWPAGIYDFEVTAGSDETSDAGNDMIKLTLDVFDRNGDKRVVFDYLLEKIAYKLRHACVACGLSDAYATGTLSGDDFTGRNGRLKLVIQPAKNGYPAKNSVRDYVFDAEQPARQEPTHVREPAPIDDDIPF